MTKKINKTMLNPAPYTYVLGDEPKEFISKVVEGEKVLVTLPEGKGSWFALGGEGKEGSFGGQPDGKFKYNATINYPMDTPEGKKIAKACLAIRKGLGGDLYQGFFKFISVEGKSLANNMNGAESVSISANSRASFTTRQGETIKNSPRVFVGDKELTEEQLSDSLPIGNGSVCSVTGKFQRGTKPYKFIRLNLDVVQFSSITPMEVSVVEPDTKLIKTKKVNPLKELAKLGLS